MLTFFLAFMIDYIVNLIPAELRPNETIFFQMVIFFASWMVLHRLVFRPYLALIHARHERGKGLREKAIQTKEKAAALKLEHETKLKEIRSRVSGWTELERKKVQDEEKTILQKARDAAAKEGQKLRDELATQSALARKELMPKIEEYSSQIVSKLVGYKVSVPTKIADQARTQESSTTI